MKISKDKKSIEHGKPLTVLDTFAGAGGFSLGFDLAGFEVIGAIEADKWACDTFAHNHPKAKTICHDITKFTDDQALEHFGRNRPDVIVGGPPCQGFSIASKTAGDPKDPRNSLFREFVRLGRVLEPHMMVMENVPNLIQAKTSDGHLVLDIIKESLADIGFHVYSTVLNATNYGVPQIRSRLFVIASRTPLENPFPLATHKVAGVNGDSLFDAPLLQCPTLWDAISDLPELAAREGGEVLDFTREAQNEYQSALRHGASKLFNHKAMNHTPRIVERFKAMKCGDSGNDVPDHLKPKKRNTQIISLDVYDQNNRRMHADRPCHTVPASFYANFVHPFQHRNFTAREGARIQSFPDWYRFLGKPTVISHKLLGREGREEEKYLCQYSQIGNAVPPLLAKAVALNLKPHI